MQRNWQVMLQWLDLYFVEHVIAEDPADCFVQMNRRYPCCVIWKCQRLLPN